MHEVISDISRKKRRTGGGEGEGEGEGENIVELGGNNNCTKTAVDFHSIMRVVINGN
jgi:hypothetical protein